jgi:hypothetical protein
MNRPLPSYDWEEHDRKIRHNQWLAKCPAEFQKPIDLSLVRPAYHTLMKWDGTFPGYCCVGDTNSGKTRACWSVLSALSAGFTYYGARDLIDAHWDWHGGMWDKVFGTWRLMHGCHHQLHVMLLDDVDKVAMNPITTELLFNFYDIVYEEQIPCLSTTNRSRQWWKDKMGEAFTRRFLDDGQKELQF